MNRKESSSMLVAALALAVAGCAPSSSGPADGDRFKAEHDFSCEGYPRPGPTGITVCELRSLRDIPTRRNIRIEGEGGDVHAIGLRRSSIALDAYVYATALTEARAWDIAAQVEIHATDDHIRATGPERETTLVTGVSVSNPETWHVSFDVQVPERTDLAASTANGSMLIAFISGAVSAHAANGDLVLGGLAGTVTGSVSNGGIGMYLGGTSWNGAGAQLTAVNGPVDFWMNEHYSAVFELRTVNGSIHSDFGGTPQTGPTGSQLTEVTGNGGRTLSASATNGDIYLRRWYSTD
jgi:hypothetical protein